MITNKPGLLPIALEFKNQLEGFSVAVSIFSKVVIVGFIAARGRTKTANPKQEIAKLQMMAARPALTNIFTIYLIALFIK